ncbi:hypothetical protein, partial [Bordetella pertussis]|uniref:hypothetical protein n=1 Tax=Bordetella pertussis TaxID=520 RepID=UPI001FED6AFD
RAGVRGAGRAGGDSNDARADGAPGLLVSVIRYLIQFDILWRFRSRLSFLIDLTAASRES